MTLTDGHLILIGVAILLLLVDIGIRLLKYFHVL